MNSPGLIFMFGLCLWLSGGCISYAMRATQAPREVLAFMLGGVLLILACAFAYIDVING